MCAHQQAHTHTHTQTHTHTHARPHPPSAPQVGVVLQRALAISLTYCVGALLLWTRSTYLLVRMGQDPHIAAAAGKFTLALGPALVLDAADQCCR